ncbi:hypothetical protein NWF32_29640 [Pseudomonas qingdaonensis]|nr:hypothetical protein [Pseudomonas qingdaonensis]
MQRHALEAGELLVMALPSQADCLLVAEGDGLLDYGLLHHVVAVLGIELERLRVDNERNLRLGSSCWTTCCSSVCRRIRHNSAWPPSTSAPNRPACCSAAPPGCHRRPATKPCNARVVAC